MDTTETLKTCTNCGQPKPIEQFVPLKPAAQFLGLPDLAAGHTPECRSCVHANWNASRAFQREHRAALERQGSEATQ